MTKVEDSDITKPMDLTKTPTMKKNWPKGSTPKHDPNTQDPGPMEGVEPITSPQSRNVMIS